MADAFELRADQVGIAHAAPGSAALAAIRQLLRELAPTIGEDGVRRVREKVEEALTATNLPADLQQAFLRGFD